MFCEKCGRELEENAKFCDKCGTVINDASKNETVSMNSGSSKVISGILKVAAIIFVVFFLDKLGFLDELINEGKWDVGEGSQSNHGKVDISSLRTTGKNETSEFKETIPVKNTPANQEVIEAYQENYYLADFLGKSIGEIIDTLGDPYKIQHGYLGGGGNDNGYMYEKGNIVFITLFDSGYDDSFDERNAKVNYIYMYQGNVDEYVRIGMTYNEIDKFYSLSDYSYSLLDDNYTATAEFAHNGCNCVLLIESYDGNKTTPVNGMILIAPSVYN